MRVDGELYVCQAGAVFRAAIKGQGFAVRTLHTQAPWEMGLTPVLAVVQADLAGEVAAQALRVTAGLGGGQMALAFFGDGVVVLNKGGLLLQRRVGQHQQVNRGRAQFGVPKLTLTWAHRVPCACRPGLIFKAKRGPCP